MHPGKGAASFIEGGLFSSGTPKWSIQHVCQTIVLNGPKHARKSAEMVHPARMARQRRHGPHRRCDRGVTPSKPMHTIKGLAPELFRDRPLFAYLAPVHVPVSSATIQAPLEFLGTARRHSNHAFLPYRAQDLSAPARARNPQPSSFGAGFRHRSRQRQPNGEPQLCCSPRSWHRSMSSSLLWMPALR